MMKVDSVIIRTAQNGYTVEPSFPYGGDIPMSSTAGDAAYAKRQEMSRPRVATTVEEALTQAAGLLGTPCDVVATSSGAEDSVLTDDPGEMF